MALTEKETKQLEKLQIKKKKAELKEKQKISDKNALLKGEEDFNRRKKDWEKFLKFATDKYSDLIKLANNDNNFIHRSQWSFKACAAPITYEVGNKCLATGEYKVLKIYSYYKYTPAITCYDSEGSKIAHFPFNYETSYNGRRITDMYFYKQGSLFSYNYRRYKDIKTAHEETNFKAEDRFNIQTNISNQKAIAEKAILKAERFLGEGWTLKTMADGRQIKATCKNKFDLVYNVDNKGELTLIKSVEGIKQIIRDNYAEVVTFLESIS